MWKKSIINRRILGQTLDVNKYEKYNINNNNNNFICCIILWLDDMPSLIFNISTALFQSKSEKCYRFFKDTLNFQIMGLKAAKWIEPEH